MCGSGVRTGTAATVATRRQTQQVPPRAPTACAVVAAGAAVPGAVECPTAPTTRRRARTTSSVSALPSSSHPLNILALACDSKSTLIKEDFRRFKLHGVDES